MANLSSEKSSSQIDTPAVSKMVRYRASLSRSASSAPLAFDDAVPEDLDCRCHRPDLSAAIDSRRFDARIALP